MTNAYVRGQRVELTPEIAREAFLEFLTVVSVRVERWGEKWGLMGRLNAPGVQERLLLLCDTRRDARASAQMWHEWSRRKR